MKLLKKPGSSRIRFAFVLFAGVVLVDLGVYLLLPAYVAGKQNAYIRESFIKRAYYSLPLIKADSEKERLELLFNSFQTETIGFLDLKSSAYSNYHSKLDIEQEKIKDLAEEEIFYFKNSPMLNSRINLKLKDISGTVSLRVGFHAKSTINLKQESRFYVFVFSIITITIAFIIFVINNILFIKPLQAITKAFSQLPEHEQKVIIPPNTTTEFIPVYQSLIKTLQDTQDSREVSNKLMEQGSGQVNDLKAALEKISDEHDYKAELLLLLAELFKIHDPDEIMQFTVTEICQRFKYHLAVLFYAERGKLQYRCSYFRGVPLINDKLRIELSGKEISESSLEYEALKNMQPFVTDHPFYFDVLQNMKLNGNFALIPVGTSGILSIGYVSGKKNMTDQDTERLMLFAHFLNVLISVAGDAGISQKRSSWLNEELNGLIDLIRQIDAFNQRMVKTISLNLQPPLRNIQALIDSIYRKYNSEITPDLESRLNRILNNADKEMAIVKDLLKAMSDRPLFRNMQDTNIKQIVSETVQEMRYFRAYFQIELINYELFPTITMDEQLIRHIIRNAFKYVLDNTGKTKDHVRLRYLADSVYHYLVFEFEIFQQVAQQKTDSGNYLPDVLELTPIPSIELEYIKVLMRVISGKTWLESNSHKPSKLWIGFSKSFSAGAPQLTELIQEQ